MKVLLVWGQEYEEMALKMADSSEDGGARAAVRLIRFVERLAISCSQLAQNCKKHLADSLAHIDSHQSECGSVAGAIELIMDGIVLTYSKTLKRLSYGAGVSWRSCWRFC